MRDDEVKTDEDELGENSFSASDFEVEDVLDEELDPDLAEIEELDIPEEVEEDDDEDGIDDGSSEFNDKYEV
ncbi:MAG: hypothetical protein WCO12_03680 [bacterium]